ncbi:MAG: elongation factor P, partial [Alphaproteobacteria bacterium]
MKILGNDIRSGYVIEHEGKIWRAVKTQMIQPGKGGAFMQVELRDVRSDNKLVTRFRSVEPVERVSLEEKDYQFLYAEGDLYTFMEPETYEQVQVRKDDIGDPAVFLQEGMICTLR